MTSWRLKIVKKTNSMTGLGPRAKDVVGLIKVLDKGVPFATLTRFQNKSGLPASVIAKVLRLPRRTLARRKRAARLSGPESERLYRLAGLYERAASLFEGDASAARHWLQSPNRGLANITPLALAESEIGARAVEDLMGRLEHGVYS